jgi:cellulose synthase/poly-beta-1,6-N-acetylglucosamine synthase-like glycosyltransferase
VSDAPRVSVVIAALDEEETIARCLRSVCAARLDGEREIIVADNNSTDRTAEVARGFPSVKVVAAPIPGAVNAKAAGVAEARAPLVAIIDADSECPPDWLEKICAAFDADPKLLGLSGPARYRNPRRWVPALMALWYGWWKFLAWLFGRALYATGTNVAFRRDAMREAGGFDTNVLVGGDEVGLFRKLRRRGMTRFDDELWVDTDPRRTDVGFVRFFFTTVMYRYVFNYLVYRITGRSLVKSYLPGSKLSAKKG